MQTVLSDLLSVTYVTYVDGRLAWMLLANILEVILGRVLVLIKHSCE